VIDASDHGVLFRVPFPSGQEDAPAVAAAAVPEQLTDTAWNCQYPAPGTEKLVTTCSSDEGLDVFELPLDGEVSSHWTAERIRLELGMAGRVTEEMLLYRHLLAREHGLTAQKLLMMRLVRLHLDRDEFAAAEFYVHHMHALRDPATAGLSYPLLTFIAHRQAIRDRERGRMADDFNAAERQRLDQLVPEKSKSPAAAVWVRLVRSEIADTLGDKGLALRELEAARVDETTARLHPWWRPTMSGRTRCTASWTGAMRWRTSVSVSRACPNWSRWISFATRGRRCGRGQEGFPRGRPRRCWRASGPM
jgi:hypothetical protein